MLSKEQEWGSRIEKLSLILFMWC